MIDRNIADLIKLIRRRYPYWENFDHPAFIVDEITYKQETIKKAQDLISKTELDKLIAAEYFDSFLNNVEMICKDNNLLWRNVPKASDSAILYHPKIDKPAFCIQIRNLLYGDRPTPDRLGSFADYVSGNGLPNKWPFPTYLLFICHPDSEIFIKPRTATWLMKFMGDNITVTSPPTALLYSQIRDKYYSLREILSSYEPHEMVDIQSFVWVCAQESKKRTGRLSSKGQVDLDIPPSKYNISSRAMPMNATLLKETDPIIDTLNPQELLPSYPLAQCAEETGFSTDQLTKWVKAIERKKQIVFYGPPGTSKTYLAEKLAQHLVGGQIGFKELVQFHPSYAYEDFIQGIRPSTLEDGSLRYDLVPGRFLQFCQKARNYEGPCVLIIDEINRANTSSVFGELMVLLEYRDREIPLAGGGALSIPKNVRMIGTMNTADRSIALVDHALRRRFAFIPLAPNFDLIRHFHSGENFDIEPLIKIIKNLNKRIGDPHYHIGHTYFLQPRLQEQIEDIWQMEIEPYLEEYFFDQPNKVDPFRWATVKSKIGM